MFFQSSEPRRAKPQDLTRLYEIILQNLAELPGLAGLEEDAQFQREVEAQTASYRAFR